MLYFIYEENELISVTDKFEAKRDAMEQGVYTIVDRNDIKSLAQATEIADQATNLTAEKHVAVDHGAHHYPRFDVIRAPHVGDEVSYAFNGDYYPCGTITQISGSLRKVTTSSGKVFWRRKQSGSWINNGTWSLIQGHRDERNPHF